MNTIMPSPLLAQPAAPAKTQFPFLDLKAQFTRIREELMSAVEKVFEDQHFILGPEVQQLETAIAKLVGTKFAIACASGSDALLLALMALNIEPGDEVITTPFTFGATAGSIARLNARPVFVDIDPETYNLDPRGLAKAITPRTRAIMPVHLFGLAADMKPISEIAHAHNLPIIEDAAQAIGAWYGDNPVGALGNMACFSFFPSKNLGCAGDGGMVTTDDAALAERLRMLRVHGCKKKYQYEVIGVNSRLDALQAAILNVKLRHLHTWTEERQQNAGRYRQLFLEYGLQNRVKAPIEPHDRVHVYNQFTIRVQNRDALRQHMHQAGIPTEIYYPFPLHLEKAYAYLGHARGDFPESEAACREAVSLPIFSEITEEQQRAVVQAVASFYEADQQ